MNPEGESSRINITIFHKLIVDGSSSVDWDGWVAQTHDTVEHGGNKCDARLLNGLGKCGLESSQTASCWCNIDIVNWLKANHWASSVLNLETGTILSPSRWLLRVVLVVIETGESAARFWLALCRWDPQVSGSGVKNYCEGLTRRTNCDWAKVLSVKVVLEWCHGNITSVFTFTG